ncbi:SDR family oxidoreductase [Novosphingobium sp. 1949]|uniref:SDR family oxidoreductase n=1 Tax=Novosphingobium organovorum TaxID=2930092 RepID=A0ABT0BCW2_9SPHN|nr:SDR family oxidoreductase [Novosphingobium organovorum]MCJ2182891.1 SDR family oxidoreductase [Novosphingobium organovorum]
MQKRLEGKSILVAGAGGIGSALAQRYALEGASVVLGDIDLPSARATVDAIVQAGGEACAVELDGAQEESIRAAVATACDRYGGLDGLHANFATLIDCDPQAGVLELPMEVYDETMRVNARGFFLCTRAVLPALIERGGGSIVYTSSAAGNGGPITQSAYAMSKSAGHALMRHVAARYGAMDVRANTIAPAMTLHPRLEAQIPATFIEWAKSAAKIKSRVGRPDDIAAMGALLLSDEGSYITGQVISIDGGTTMRP